ncbi:MAG: glycosyl hydrolase [Planctomycetota bacterium]|jgi:hypothetical protein
MRCVIVGLVLAALATATDAATDAAIEVSAEQWGVSTRYIGANEGDVRFCIEDLTDCGINTYRIYGDMSRFEPADDDGVYGSPSIEEIKADPNVIPWERWDEVMDAPKGYAYTNRDVEVSIREQFEGLKGAGIRTVIALRNRDTHLEPTWSPAVPRTGEDWNEWWAYCFAMAYWLNVRNDYGVDDFEVLNEPDIPRGQGWTGTQEEYFEMVRRTKDAVDYVYRTYLPARTYRIHAPVTAGGRWTPATLEAVGEELDCLNVHSYDRNLENFIRGMHYYLDETGYPDYPLWISEWATYRLSYDNLHLGLSMVANLIRGSRPGNDYV